MLLYYKIVPSSYHIFLQKGSHCVCQKGCDLLYCFMPLNPAQTLMILTHNKYTAADKRRALCHALVLSACCRSDLAALSLEKTFTVGRTSISLHLLDQYPLDGGPELVSAQTSSGLNGVINAASGSHYSFSLACLFTLVGHTSIHSNVHTQLVNGVGQHLNIHS